MSLIGQWAPLNIYIAVYSLGQTHFPCDWVGLDPLVYGQRPTSESPTPPQPSSSSSPSSPPFPRFGRSNKPAMRRPWRAYEDRPKACGFCYKKFDLWWMICSMMSSKHFGYMLSVWLSKSSCFFFLNVKIYFYLMYG